MPVYNVSEFEKIDGKFLKSVYFSADGESYVIHVFLKEQNAGTNTSTLRLVYTKSTTSEIYTSGDYKVVQEINNHLQDRTVTVPHPTSGNALSADLKLYFLFRLEQQVTHSVDGTGEARIVLFFSGRGTGLAPRYRYNDYKKGGSFPPRPDLDTTIPLDRIDRVSNLSLGSSNTLTIGESSAITINRKADIFTHTLRYEFGTATGTIASNVGASQTWSVPASLASQIPNAASGPGKLHIDTFHGTTKIGTTTTSVTFQVANSIRPTLTGITLTDLNTRAAQLLGANNFAQGASDVKITFNGAAGIYGSTIRNYQAEIVSRNQAVTSNGASFGAMNWHGTATVRATVTDSRGRTSLAREVTITVLPYQAPFIEFTTARVGSAGTQLMVYRLAGISPLTLNGQQKNTMTLSFEVAEYGSTNFRAVTGAANGTWTSVTSLNNSGALLDGTYAVDRTYIVRGTITDKLQPVPFEAMLRTEDVVQSWSKHGLGIKKVWERGALDVGGDAYFDGVVYINGVALSPRSLTSGNPVLGYGKTSVDANTTYDTGFYWTNQNVPGGDWGMLETYRFSEKEGQQVFRQRNGSRSWSRYRNHQTGVWTGWVVVGLDQFFPVGAVFSSTINTSPQSTLGGSWQSLGQTAQNGNTLYSWKRTS